MVGRGSTSSFGKSVVLRTLLKNNGGKSATNLSTEANSSLRLTADQMKGNYTDNGNAALLKWQQQTDDKAANFLAKVDRTTDLSQIQQATGDKWAFYDNPQQKFVESMNLNGKATVLSESDFNKYVRQTGATVIYRGWSGQNAIDRFKNSPNSHIGNGINGDGYYFSTDRGTAVAYGGTGTKAALSPNARVVSLSDVNKAIAKADPKFQRSLSKAGGGGTRTYGANDGQAQMALKMGYNAIDAGWSLIVLTRDAVIVSDKNNW